MKPINIFAGAALVLAMLAIVWTAGALPGAQPQVRVTCQDPERGYLSADMDRDDIIETPCGWVLRFPHRATDRQVEVWQTCEVGR